MSTNLDDYEYDYGKAVSYPAAEENGLSFMLQNDSKLVVKKWAIDNVIFKDRKEKRCDYLLFVKGTDVDIYYWIELKGSDVIKACEQILSTISMIVIDKNAIQHSRIISIRVYERDARDNTYRRLDKMMRATGGNLHIYHRYGLEKI